MYITKNTPNLVTKILLKSLWWRTVVLSQFSDLSQFIHKPKAFSLMGNLLTCEEKPYDTVTNMV